MFSRIDLRCRCRMRNSIGSSPSFSAISSIAISSAIMPGRFAGRAHGVAFGKIEHRQTRGGHAIRAGVEQARLMDRAVRPAARQVAGPALMADRGDLAVRRGADADALDRRGPMRRVVEHQRTLQRHLHGPPAARAPSAASTASARRNSLPPKPPPMYGEMTRTFSFGDAQRLRQVGRAPVDHLVRGPERQLVAVPRGDGGMRLHHRVRLVGRGVRGIELAPAPRRTRRRSRRRRYPAGPQ